MPVPCTWHAVLPRHAARSQWPVHLLVAHAQAAHGSGLLAVHVGGQVQAAVGVPKLVVVPAHDLKARTRAA